MTITRRFRFLFRITVGDFRTTLKQHQQNRFQYSCMEGKRFKEI